MRIAVLHPSLEGSSSPFKDMDPDCDPSRYLPDDEWENSWIAKPTARRQIADIARRGCDIAVNLCDGAWDENRAGIEVVQALELLGMAFTGAGPEFCDPSREAMKMACDSVGVGLSAYVMAADLSDV